MRLRNDHDKKYDSRHQIHSPPDTYAVVAVSSSPNPYSSYIPRSMSRAGTLAPILMHARNAPDNFLCSEYASLGGGVSL